MAKGIKRKIAIARKNVEKEIRVSAGYGEDISPRQRFFARGLSGEGYFAGYRDALDDVILALNGVTPNRKGFWGWYSKC